VPSRTSLGLFFRLTLVLRHDLRPRDRHELGVNLVGDGACDQRLPGAGRAVQQDAGGRFDAEASEQFRLRQREFDHLADQLEFLVQAADVLVGDAGSRLEFGRFGLELGVGTGRRPG